MALCIIAQRGVFSTDYNNYSLRGYDVDALVSRVRDLLREARPELVWLPETSQIGVEHNRLRTARAEKPVDEIEPLMADLWAQAAQEQLSKMTPAERDFCKLVDNAPDINTVLRLNEQKAALARSVPDIAAAAGLSHRKLAERFGIPYRTMEAWCSGDRQCAPYVRLMMQECLGLYKPQQ